MAGCLNLDVDSHNFSPCTEHGGEGLISARSVHSEREWTPEEFEELSHKDTIFQQIYHAVSEGWDLG
ncbi:unnamed protein product [Urochloa humidicola]